VKTKPPGAETIATPSSTADPLPKDKMDSVCVSPLELDDHTGMDDNELGNFLMDALSDEFDCNDDDFLGNLCA